MAKKPVVSMARKKRKYKFMLDHKERDLIRNYRKIKPGGKMRRHVRELAEHHAGLRSKN